jgi:hypothetical protein
LGYREGYLVGIRRPSTYSYPPKFNKLEDAENYSKRLYAELLENDSRGEEITARATDKDLKELIVRPEWYGAKGDGVKDDYTALSKAFSVSGNAIPVVLSGGSYATSRQLSLLIGTEGPKIIGNGSTIKAIAGTWNAGDAVIKVGNTTSLHTDIQDLTLDADGLSTYGFHGEMITEPRSSIRNVMATGATSHGWYLVKCQVANFENIQADYNGGDGIYAAGCNVSSIVNPRATGNTGNGITIAWGGVGFNGGLYLGNPNVEGNSGHGISIEETLSPVIVDGGWGEGNTLHGINVDAKHVTILSPKLAGAGSGTNYWAYLNTHAVDAAIIGGTASYTGNANFATIGQADTTTAYIGLNNRNVTDDIILPSHIGGDIQIGGYGTGAGHSRDFSIDSGTINLGRLSDSGGDNSTVKIRNRLGTSVLEATGASLGFFGSAVTTKPDITGVNFGNAALADLLSKLSTLGLVSDSTTAGDAPTFSSLIVSNGGTVGQAAGPLLTFDDTNNYLEITGCKVGVGTAVPTSNFQIGDRDITDSGLLTMGWTRNTFLPSTTEDGMPHLFSSDGTGGGDFGGEAGHLVIQPRVHASVYRDIIFASGLTTPVLIMVIKGEGKVGINDPDPGELLDVNGNINTTGVVKVADTQVLGAQAAAQADLKADYQALDLDTEAEIITAINATNSGFNALLAKLRVHGILDT